MKPFYKRGWFISVVVILVFAVFGKIQSDKWKAAGFISGEQAMFAQDKGYTTAQQYAESNGFINAENWNTAYQSGITSADEYAEQLGFINAAHWTTAADMGITDPDAFAVSLGFDDSEAWRNAISAGITDPNEYALHLENEERAARQREFDEEQQARRLEIDANYPVDPQGCPVDSLSWNATADALLMRGLEGTERASIEQIVQQCRSCVNRDYQLLRNEGLYEQAETTIDQGTDACTIYLLDVYRRMR